MNWNYLINSLVPLLGAAAVFKGWQTYSDTPPKLTEKDSVTPTHTDYISGNYEKDLKERQQLIDSYRNRGRWLVIVGSTLVLGGFYMLGRGVRTSREK